jgi:hypothetical protein
MCFVAGGHGFMNAKHAETSIKISEESHTGIKLFIPYCDTQGCQWIGDIHLDKLSAQQEGESHLVKIKPHAVQVPDRTALQQRTLALPARKSS